ncbi:hypothetical protein C5S31_03355 [ANME-1 cluster archaeon GoMg2]|nr:hypothetical protein [ANME-1 cluster archaeon GoMg2]
MEHNAVFNEIQDHFGTLTGLAGTEEAELLIEVFQELYIDNQCRGDRLWGRLCDTYAKLRPIMEADRKTFTERLIKYVSDCHRNGDKGPQGPQVRTNTFDENDFYFLDRLTPEIKHLNKFAELSYITGLFGTDYVIIKKALWYSLQGTIAPIKIIKLGDAIYTDVRFNPCFPIPSGAGKKGLSTTIEELTKRMGLDYKSPTSLHPEQLVGKVILRGRGDDKQYIQNYGYLKSDYLLFDDANILLTAKENNYEESRRYICRALDPIGRNEIYKRLVDNMPEESLTYVPECSISMCIQPTFLPEGVVAGGLMRRFMIVYVRLFGTMVDRPDEFHARLHSNRDREQDIAAVIGYYKKIVNRCDGDFTFTEKAIDEIERLHIELITIAKTHSAKGRNYTDRLAFGLQDILIKMAAIQAFSCCRTEINESDVQLGYMDLFEFYCSTLDFIEHKILGFLDYGETWRGATSTDAKCLEFLFANGAVSEAVTTITISEYIEFIAKLRNITERSAERDYYKHIKKGWIYSKQVGKRSSVVWLAFSPKTTKIINPQAIDLEKTEYYKISENLPEIIKKRKCMCGPADPADPADHQRKSYKAKSSDENQPGDNTNHDEPKDTQDTTPEEMVFTCICGECFKTPEDLHEHNAFCDVFQAKQAREAADNRNRATCGGVFQ